MMENTFVKWGLISGLVFIIITIINYYIYSINILILTLLLFVITTLLMIFNCNEELEKNGGYITYGRAFKTIFLASIIGAVISFIFTMILKTVDTGFEERALNLTLESTENMMKGLNVPQDQLDETMDKLSKKNPFSSKQLIKSLFQGLLVNAAFAAIIAAIMQKNKNPFDNQSINA